MAQPWGRYYWRALSFEEHLRNLGLGKAFRPSIFYEGRVSPFESTHICNMKRGMHIYKVLTAGFISMGRPAQLFVGSAVLGSLLEILTAK